MLDTVGPIDEIQMGDADQGALVLAPLGTADTDKAVVGALDFVHQVVGDAEDGEEMRGGGSAVAKVADRGRVGDDRVEVAGHMGGGQLRKGIGGQAELVEDGIQAREQVGPNVAKDHVGGRGATVRRRNRGQ